MIQPTNQDTEAPPLSRDVHVSDIEDNAPQTIEATAAERAAVKDLLDLADLGDLRFDYRLRHGGGGRVHLSGRLKADVTQTCVISLEPVEAAVDTPVELEFWPAPLVEDLERKAEDDPGQAEVLDWPETITDGTIDLGPVVYETLATALDPYPKKEGARLEWQEASAAEAPKSGPFAALEQLKKR